MDRRGGRRSQRFFSLTGGGIGGSWDYLPTVEEIPGNRAGSFPSVPRGVILHGSRSGSGNNTDREYAGTVNYVRNGASGLGWNATIGDDVVGIHIGPDGYGWNARAASSKYLAVEFAQAVETKPISDAQVKAFCWWFISHVYPRWPSIPLNFPTHAELEARGETGQRDGKTDVFSNGSPQSDELRSRILTTLQAMGLT